MTVALTAVPATVALTEPQALARRVPLTAVPRVTVALTALQVPARRVPLTAVPRVTVALTALQVPARKAPPMAVPAALTATPVPVATVEQTALRDPR